MAGSTAHSASTSRLTETSYSRINGGSPGEALSNSYRNLETAATGTRADFDRAYSSYTRQLGDAEKLRDQGQKILDDIEAKKQAITKRASEAAAKDPTLAEKAMAGDQQAYARLNEVRAQSAASQREIEGLEAEASRVRDQYGIAKGFADRTQKDIEDRTKLAYGQGVDFKGDVKSQLEQMDRKVRMEGADRLTTQFLDSVKDDYNRSGLLISDLQTMKDKFKFDDEKIKKLQEQLQGRIDNTLLGKYLDKKLCDFFTSNKAAACVPSSVGQSSPAIGESSRSPAGISDDSEPRRLPPTAPAPSIPAAAKGDSNSAQ